MGKGYYKELFYLEDRNWWFLARREIISSLLDRYLKNKKSLQILDIGTGTGRMLELLEYYGKTTGIDYSDETIKFCRKRGFTNVIKGDAHHLPFNDNFFDLICAFDLIEHLECDEEAIKEFFRVLRKGGILFLTVPAFMFFWNENDEFWMHKRRYAANQIQMILKKARFKIEKLSYFNFLLFPIVFLIRCGRKILKIKNKELKSDFKDYPYFINEILRKIFSFEKILLKYINLPFGVSILCIAKK